MIPLSVSVVPVPPWEVVVQWYQAPPYICNFQRLRACTNTIGSFECGACLGGNTENADGNCTDFDECMNGVHDCIIPGGYCANKPGTFDCPRCMDGFIGPDGRDCTDVDECEEDLHDCNVAVVCKNTIGEYVRFQILLRSPSRA